MFNRTDNFGSHAGSVGDTSNSGNNTGFQRLFASNNVYHNLANRSVGLTSVSSDGAQNQRNASSLAAQTQALAKQQQRLLQMTKNELEVQQMASNIKESLLIKQRLESIQHLQQEEANKIRTELHLKAAAQQVGQNSTGNDSSRHRLVSSGCKTIPSSSNIGILPFKQREDEMTKPDLSTLAETAVAVASARNAANSHSRKSSTIMGIENIIKMKSSNISGNRPIPALLERQASSSALSQKGSISTSQSLPTSITSSMSTNAMADALRRNASMNRDKLHLEHNFKRSLEEMTKSNTSASQPSSWLWKSATLGNTNPIPAERLRAQHEQLQRRNSLPAPVSATSSEFASLRSLKRQRVLEQKANEIGGLEFQDAMKQMRQLDANMKMHMSSNNSLLAKMAFTIASQERRGSIASSIASVGTSATAPNLTANTSLSSPAHRSNLAMRDSSSEERSKVLNKLNKMSGGFPMPKFIKKLSNDVEGGDKRNIPAEITPELDKDIVDITRRATSSSFREEQLESNQQSRYLERIGGFPMPPLYILNSNNTDVRNLSSNNRNEANTMYEDHYDDARKVNESCTLSKNAISSHIRNNVNRSGTKASRPPALESYKRVWRDIRLVAGDDPQVDEHLRKELFARKLQRGEIVEKTRNCNFNNANRYKMQQQRLSELSQGTGGGNTSSNERRANSSTGQEESIVI